MGEPAQPHRHGGGCRLGGAVKARDASVIGREIKGKIDNIRGAGGAVGQTTRAAGYAARHVLAQVVGIGGLVSLLIGLGLMAAGIFWK